MTFQAKRLFDAGPVEIRMDVGIGPEPAYFQASMRFGRLLAEAVSPGVAQADG